MDGTVFDAVVEDIERGQVAGERLYRIRYTDGDAEHLTAFQCLECCLPDHLQARLDAADKDVQMSRLPLVSREHEEVAQRALKAAGHEHEEVALGMVCDSLAAVV